jgi:hypothetical protein
MAETPVTIDALFLVTTAQPYHAENHTDYTLPGWLFGV